MRLPHIRAHNGMLIPILARPMPDCPSTPPLSQGYPHQQALRGNRRERVLACAEAPRQEQGKGAITILRYYQEAPRLEEAMASSKSSRPALHHGCWAPVVIQHQRVDQVRYRFGPSSVDASNDCEEIFANCPE